MFYPYNSLGLMVVLYSSTFSFVSTFLSHITAASCIHLFHAFSILFDPLFHILLLGQLSFPGSLFEGISCWQLGEISLAIILQFSLLIAFFWFQVLNLFPTSPASSRHPSVSSLSLQCCPCTHHIEQCSQQTALPMGNFPLSPL